MSRRLNYFSVAVCLAGAIALVGCVTAGPQGSTSSDPAANPTAGTQPGGSPASGSGGGGPLVSVGRRAQSAVGGLVIGAAIGAQAGPIGAAVGAGTFLIYGALTGHSPLDNRSGQGGGHGGYGSVTDEERREAALEEQIAQEAARGNVLEDEIADELDRQEELLHQIERDEAASQPTQAAQKKPGKAPAPDPVTDENLAERADPRVAPAAPKDRELPLAIFEKEKVTIPAGEWGNKKKLEVVKRSLDADRDGSPEQIRYYDESGEIIRKEQDQNFDSRMDAWSTYRNGSLRERVLDTSGDGKPDAWETYETGKMTKRQVDRDRDGVRDAFYTYERGSLVEERHDADNDGNMDLIVTYEDRHRVRAEEDRDKNGGIDMWSTYRVVDDVEIVARVEKDETGDGKPNIFETFTAKNGKPILAKREEDKNGDGNIDVTSIYKNGKLVRREISDPNMVPL
jgi:antitoxin component YwqK of YwqJK toxin-antitoxin module